MSPSVLNEHALARAIQLGEVVSDLFPIGDLSIISWREAED
ncbi:MAG: hypothetical protein WKF84_17060 [Pyrinomonadaceae bacterium]